MQSINRIIKLNEKNINDTAKSIERLFNIKKIPATDIEKTKISVETVLKSWLEAFGENHDCQIKIYSRLGALRIAIRIAGNSFNPLKTEVYDLNQELDNYYSNILTNMDLSIHYNFHNGINEIEIKLPVKKPKGTTSRIILGIIFAFIIGGIFDSCFPAETTKLIASDLTGPLVKTLLGLLNGVAGIMIFISMVAAICNMGDVSTLGNIGSSTMKQFMGKVFLAAAITLPTGIFCFGILESGSEINFSILTEIYKLILAMIPTNMVEPFVKGDTMRMLVIAVLIGYTMLHIGKKVRNVLTIINELNNLLMSMVNMVCRLLPVIVFLSLLNLLLKGDFENLVNVWKLLLFNAVFIGVFLVGSFAYIAKMKNLSLTELINNILPIFILGATTMSSPPCLTLIDKTCQEKYHVKDNVRNFAVPFGQPFYMPYHAIALISYVVGLADIYNVTISISTACMLFICCNIMVYTIPPIPMGIMTILALLLNMAGVPSEALAIAMSVDFIMGMMRMLAKVAGVTAEIIALDRRIISKGN